MPEGHVLHRLAREFSAAFGGEEVRASSPQGRFAVEAERLDGSVFAGAEAIGKHLFLSFDMPEPSLVHIHLGLIGRFDLMPLAPPVGVVRLRIATDEMAADLRGPQWCRAVTHADRDAVLAKSGPDPLRADADPALGYARLRASAKPVASLIMDQRIAAGVGNIYRAEVLFRHGIDPSVPGRQIDPATWRALWDDLAELMEVGVQEGQIHTVRREHSPEVQRRPPRVDAHGGEVYVYRRAGQPCLVCGTEVAMGTLEGRNLYWCPRCQTHSRAEET
ncbi:MAG TPA: zinc finger domain-containing protein [Arachnia sp.]|nr:zinc finger domain-containing protein [Arachnia sp.]HMT87596.1 zinc finger domain-containing protein [Arachnia sp.]